MTYKVVVTHTDEGYSVGCPEFPECKSQGETEEEAVSKIREAIQERLAVKPTNGKRGTVLFVEVPETFAGNWISHAPAERRPFEVKPFPMGLPPGGSYDKIEDLLDLLEGQYRR